MFKVDMEAIREAALEVRLMANPANLANGESKAPPDLAELATLAVSQTERALIDPAVRNLLVAAMRACEHFHDSADNRMAMVKECLDTPEHLRADLTAHFESLYRGSRH